MVVTRQQLTEKALLEEKAAHATTKKEVARLNRELMEARQLAASNTAIQASIAMLGSQDNDGALDKYTDDSSLSAQPAKVPATPSSLAPSLPPIIPPQTLLREDDLCAEGGVALPLAECKPSLPPCAKYAGVSGLKRSLNEVEYVRRWLPHVSSTGPVPDQSQRMILRHSSP